MSTEYGYDQIPVLDLLPWGLPAALIVLVLWISTAEKDSSTKKLVFAGDVSCGVATSPATPDVDGETPRTVSSSKHPPA